MGNQWATFLTVLAEMLKKWSKKSTNQINIKSKNFSV
jgi:hypothetical protein